ncbi:MAG: hormogonium polysaccharide biosynthesis protein HpsA [Cyanobacteria bacterium P01_A01_bin.45]
MSLNRQLVKGIKNFYRKLNQKSLSTIEEQRIWLLRTFLITKKRQEWVNSGFVLPTVAMVSIVVVLLTTAIMFRAFKRSENASNVRVNQAVLNAATPAIERAKAKLDKLFTSNRLPRATPTDTAIQNEFNNYIDDYTFGDERQLQLSNNGDTHQTAWMYPVDTDNNGRFDSYTIYGIYYRTPTGNAKRTSLEARTPPMIGGSLGDRCGDILGTSATLVGGGSWYRIGGKLKKSFFAYTVNVPITNINQAPTGNSRANYEEYQGNQGFSAIEYQQDRIQLPLVNNAVLYEDDIALAPGADFNLNGRIFTNSNFITGGVGNANVRLFQVSSKDSCFYEEDNAKIIIGGNIGAGGFTDGSDLRNGSIVHLFKGKGVNPDTNIANTIKNDKSVNASPRDIAYNSLAYVQRINSLVQAQITRDPSGNTDPQEVKDGIGNDTSGKDPQTIRVEQLETYFERRTRKVPYAEVAFNGNALAGVTNPLQGSGDTLRPVDRWIYPYNPNDNKTSNGYSNLALKTNGTRLKPAATETEKQQIELNGVQQYVGDRVLVGNNLPELWWDKNKQKFVGPNQQDTQEISATTWDDGDGTRTRNSRIEALVDLGKIDRNEEWEEAAADEPATPLDSTGGLRVITGAGIYLPANYRVGSTNFTNAEEEIWSDMMPVASATATTGTVNDPRTVGNYVNRVILPNPSETPYLRMRATAVYHYKGSNYDKDNPKPIACVSSYYDPTNAQTSRNKTGLPDISRRTTITGLTGLPTVTSTTAGNSNNGVVYRPPTRTENNYRQLLNYQATLRYPNGRLVNEELQQALATTASNRTLSQKSAIDSALCALQILDNSIGSPTDGVVPHGAIYETSFLDGRQIKAVHPDQGTPGVETFTNADGNGTVTAAVPNTADYDLSIEERQPLEIRATVIDIDLLRRKPIGTNTGTGINRTQEYLLPNSGLIYSSRDDALRDLSTARTGTSQAAIEQQKRESPVDFILDPTRRPNAIVLINGEKIWRTNTYREVEKGLILASNLPVYIKGDFNLHTQEEFTAALTANWSNFYTRTENQLNTQFACRKDDPRLPNCNTGDEWRPASILSDAVTLLSGNFRFGFRNEGDYDLNNNLGDTDSINAFGQNGLSRNAYVTNANWYDPANGYLPRDLDTSSAGFQGSSYINNFVTPVQRRARFNEYLMEVCPKLPVSTCQPDDWVVTSTGERTWDIAGGIVGKTVGGASPQIESGTTAKLPSNLDYQNFGRRLAFKRDSSGNLELDSSNRPIPLGIDASNTVQEYPYGGSSKPRLDNAALWFKTTTQATTPTSDNNTTEHPSDQWLLLNSFPSATQIAANPSLLQENPRLSPVLQIDKPNTPPPGTSRNNKSVGPGDSLGNRQTWLQQATNTTFNIVVATGDTPARPTEDNGGLHNFVRFAENWIPSGNFNNMTVARIYGSFIQIQRSKYATAPFRSLLNGGYRIVGNSGRAPFYIAPGRQWGYDVGLLSQSPDLFAQKLVRTPDDLPDEFFREVGRDDPWVANLLCAREGNSYVLPADQRPTCP